MTSFRLLATPFHTRATREMPGVLCKLSVPILQGLARRPYVFEIHLYSYRRLKVHDRPCGGGLAPPVIDHVSVSAVPVAVGGVPDFLINISRRQDADQPETGYRALG